MAQKEVTRVFRVAHPREECNNTSICHRHNSGRNVSDLFESGSISLFWSRQAATSSRNLLDNDGEVGHVPDNKVRMARCDMYELQAMSDPVRKYVWILYVLDF
jgi:hypothetical protein